MIQSVTENRLFWEIVSESELEQKISYLKTTLDILTRIKNTDSNRNSSLLKRTITVINAFLVEAESEKMCELPTEGLLKIGKIAAAILCKYDTNFFNSYNYNKAKDTKLDEILFNTISLKDSVSSLSLLYLNTLQSLASLCSMQPAPLALKLFEKECCTMLDVPNYNESIVSKFYLFSQQHTSIWTHPNLKNAVVYAKRFSEWKLGEWFLWADSITINSEAVKDNIFTWIKALHLSSPFIDIKTKAKVLCDVYDLLTSIETRDKRLIEIRKTFSALLVTASLDWEGAGDAGKLHYLKALAAHLIDFNENKPKGQFTISSQELKETIAFAGLYKPNQIPELQWQLWEHGLALPYCEQEEKTLKLRKLWYENIISWKLQWEECMQNAKAHNELAKNNKELIEIDMEELNSLTVEQRILYLKSHSPFRLRDNELQYVAMHSLCTAGYGQQNNILYLLRRFSSITVNERIIRFWLLGEGSLSPFLNSEVKHLRELMPLLISESSQPFSEKLRTFSHFCSLRIEIQDKQIINAHRSLVEAALPFLEGIVGYEENILIKCDLSFDEMKFILDKACYAGCLDPFFGVSKVNSIDPTTILRFMQRYGTASSIQQIKDELCRFFFYKPCWWQITHLASALPRESLIQQINSLEEEQFLPLLFKMLQLGIGESYQACMGVLKDIDPKKAQEAEQLLIISKYALAHSK